MDTTTPFIVPLTPFAKAKYAFMRSSDSNIFAALASDIRKLQEGSTFVIEGHERGARYFYDARSDGQDFVRLPNGQTIDLPSKVSQPTVTTSHKHELFQFYKTVRQLTFPTESNADFFRDFDKPL